MNAAKAENGITLEMTFLGRVLDKITKATNNSPYLNPLWGILSKSYARGAVEVVYVYQSLSRGVGINSNWVTKEYPELVKRGVKIIYRYVK